LHKGWYFTLKQCKYEFYHRFSKLNFGYFKFKIEAHFFQIKSFSNDIIKADNTDPIQNKQIYLFVKVLKTYSL